MSMYVSDVPLNPGEPELRNNTNYQRRATPHKPQPHSASGTKLTNRKIAVFPGASRSISSAHQKPPPSSGRPPGSSTNTTLPSLPHLTSEGNVQHETSHSSSVAGADRRRSVEDLFIVRGGGKAATPTATVATPLEAVTSVKTKRKKRVIVNVSRCRYDCVRRAAESMGWLVEDFESPLDQHGKLSTSEGGTGGSTGGGPNPISSSRTGSSAALKGSGTSSRRLSSSCSSRGMLAGGPGNGAGTGALSIRDLTKAPIAPVPYVHSKAADLVRKYKRHYNPEQSCHLYWSDMSVLLPRVAQLKCWQRVNHFPGMTVICRKASLAQQLNKLSAKFGAQICDFFPLSFSLKTEKNRIKQYCQALRKPKTFIMKPNSGCQGKGILLTRHPIRTAEKVLEFHDQDYTVQSYIHRPLLIDGKKFDMRIYVMVTSVNPTVTMFVHREGLVRIASHNYVKPAKNNLQDVRAHLTNYAVNKGDDSFKRCDDDEAGEEQDEAEENAVGSFGNKRDFVYLERYINDFFMLNPNGSGDIIPRYHDEESAGDKNGGGAASGDDEEVEDDTPRDHTSGGTTTGEGKLNSDTNTILTPWQELWRRIDKAMVLTVASGIDSIQQNYVAATGSTGGNGKDGRICFELLGFDVLVTQSMKPYIIEVNHSPSFFTDSPLDERVKDQVMLDVMRQLNPYLLDVRKTGDLHYCQSVIPKQFVPATTVAGAMDLDRDAPKSMEKVVEQVNHSQSQFRRICPDPTFVPDTIDVSSTAVGSNGRSVYQGVLIPQKEDIVTQPLVAAAVPLTTECSLEEEDEDDVDLYNCSGVGGVPVQSPPNPRSVLAIDEELQTMYHTVFREMSPFRPTVAGGSNTQSGGRR